MPIVSLRLAGMYRTQDHRLQRTHIIHKLLSNTDHKHGQISHKPLCPRRAETHRILVRRQQVRGAGSAELDLDTIELFFCKPMMVRKNAAPDNLSPEML